MPLTGTYEWSEKKDLIQVSVPLKGVAPAKVDIIATSSTLKINYSPYLIDIVLHGVIDSQRHKARVKNGSLIVTLYKATAGLWGALELSDEAEAKQVRKDAVEKQHVLDEELAEKRKDRRIADERLSTRKQMALEEAERNRLESKKEEEKKIAEEDMYATFSKMQSSSASSASSPATATHASQTLRKIDEEMDLDDIDEGEETLEEPAEEIYSSHYEHAPCVLKSKEVEKEDVDADIKYIPPPRRPVGAEGTASVGINFTPRVFPTPMRESKQAEEEDWVAKNRKHLKKHGQLGKNLTKGNGVDISEEDPAWLKAKGDDFFRGGDYRSAINAYSSALDVDEKMISCLSNRSMCYLKLGAAADCRGDCEDGIALLRQVISDDSSLPTELVSAHKSLVKLLLRKGISNCQLGSFAGAVEDYEQGLQVLEDMARGDKSLVAMIESTRKDLDKLRLLHQADVLKKKGDAVFADGDLGSALGLYSEALEAAPMHVGCLSNRAACKIASKDFSGCVADCSAALSTMESPYGGNKGGSTVESLGAGAISMMTAILPPEGSDRRKGWFLKTLVRRGAAYAQMRMIDEAIADYGKACAMDPTNDTLKTDLNNLTNFRAGQRNAQQSSLRSDT